MQALATLAVVARLVGDAPGGLSASDIESTAREAAAWFPEIELLGPEDGRRVEPALRRCGADEACLMAALRELGVGLLLYAVVIPETGLATADLRAVVPGQKGATGVAELGDSVPDAVRRAVTSALQSSGRRRAARLSVLVTPPQAIIAVDARPLSSGDQLVLAPGPHTVEASAPDFEPARRRVELGEGEQQTVELTLVPAPGPFDPWWPWVLGGVALVGAGIAVVAALGSGADAAVYCYGGVLSECAGQR